jgi:hypothetical protein
VPRSHLILSSVGQSSDILDAAISRALSGELWIQVLSSISVANFKVKHKQRGVIEPHLVSETLPPSINLLSRS